jgi:peptidase E
MKRHFTLSHNKSPNGETERHVLRRFFIHEQSKRRHRLQYHMGIYIQKRSDTLKQSLETEKMIFLSPYDSNPLGTVTPIKCLFNLGC